MGVFVHNMVSLLWQLDLNSLTRTQFMVWLSLLGFGFRCSVLVDVRHMLVGFLGEVWLAPGSASVIATSGSSA